ncbi:MAG: protein kinase [Candidatus Eremiobacteraeota bacterium]|nr:protein kinase [Candidatus Eremiobacteraeota bacterium]
MKCPVCGTDNKDTATFCFSCGYALLQGSNVFRASRNPTVPTESSTVNQSPPEQSSQASSPPPAGASSQDSSHLSPKTIHKGRYQINRKLGQGGMGEVYLANDTVMHSKVVVKEMKSKNASTNDRIYFEKRFEEEARLLFRLKHNNLPRVTDLFKEGESYFLVMEYIEGENLEDVAGKRPDGRITVDECIEWMGTALEILKYLHGQKPPVVHRDIKPSNIMLTETGDIFIVDFGIARTVGTRTYTLVGTPGFISPEHMTGKLCLSSDIYSLGATLHFLLTGDNPQNRDPFDFPPLSKYRDDIPEGLQDIFDKMIAMKRDDRYRRVEDVLTDLANIKCILSPASPFSVGGTSPSRFLETSPSRDPEQQPSSAMPPSESPAMADLLPAPVRPQKKRTPIIPLVILIACIITTAVLFVYTRNKTKSGKTVLPSSGGMSSSQYPDKQTHSISPGIQNEPQLKKWKCLRTLKGHSSDVNSVAFSPDGKYMASGSNDKTIKMWNKDTGKCLRTLKGHSSDINSVKFSPDSKYIASGSYDHTIKIWDADSGECLRTLKGHSGSVYSVAFSPDGKYIASGGWDKTIKIWDADTGECLKTLIGHTLWVRSIAFSPDGKNIATGSSDKTIKIWAIDTGECLKTLKGHSDYVISVAFSPDGQYLASGGWDKTIKIWNKDTGECLKTLEGYSIDIESVAFSPDGKHIASGGRDNTIRIWNKDTGKCSGILEGHSGWVFSVTFSPDGRYIASGSKDKTIKIWRR